MKDGNSRLQEFASRIEVEDVLGLPKEEILAKKHNLWIGVSLDNKWFTEENLRALIAWSLIYTKENVLVWIPGRLQAVNYRYMDNMRRAGALKRGFDEESRKSDEVRRIVLELGTKAITRIELANYDDICTPVFIKRREILFRAFADQGKFHDRVIEIAREVLSRRGRTVTNNRLDSMALYTLEELPLFFSGVQKIGSNLYYNVELYPGVGKMDQLTIDLLSGKVFPGLTRALDLRDPVGIVSIRVNERT